MSDWQTFLDAQGARLEPNGETHFAADDTPLDDNTTYLCELGYQQLIALEGPEAVSFLQGQVTCDTRELLEGRWCAGAQCNLKGRMFASFTLAARDPDAHQLLMRTHGETRQLLQEGLAKYAVFSKVTLSDASEQWRRLGLAGPEAAELLRQQTDLEPAVGEYAYTDTVVAVRLAEERFELWVSDAVAQKFWLTLSENCRLAGSNWWQLADIRDGVGSVRAQTSEAFTPQSLNYQLIDAVSFKKGCYTGQEVVARLHYKGKLKKHMYRVGFDWDGPLPEPGTDILNTDGKNRGDLVLAARAGQGRAEALAVLPEKDTQTLHIGAQGAKIERLNLPYAIPSGDNDA